MFISARHRLEIYFQEIYYGKFRYLITINYVVTFIHILSTKIH